MIVKFSKKQIKALASIHSRAISFYNERHAEKPDIYREEDKNDIVRCFMVSLLENIIEYGESYLED